MGEEWNLVLEKGVSMLIKVFKEIKVLENTKFYGLGESALEKKKIQGGNFRWLTIYYYNKYKKWEACLDELFNATINK